MPTTTTYDVFSTVSEGNITVAAGSNYTIQETSLSAYNSLTTKEANVLYVITE